MRVEDCLFCKIVDKQLGSVAVAESDRVYAFRDINPAAPTHVLVVPKRHLSSAHELKAGDGDLLGEMFELIASIAEDEGVADGYRVVTNIGAPAGQSVFHLHLHVIGGREMAWPPG